MKVFKNKNNGKEVVFNSNFERMLEKNVNLNNHSYIRYRIALAFGKKIYAKLFLNLHERSYMTQELINRRIELCRDMMGEIKRDYGVESVKYLKRFL